MYRFLLVPLAFLALPAWALAAGDLKAREIERLIKQLGDDSFKVREEAGRKLVKDYGESALDALAKAAQGHDDPEVARRAAATIRAIEATTKWEVAHTGVIDAVAVSPDGRYALSGSSDHTVRLWRLPR